MEKYQWSHHGTTKDFEVEVFVSPENIKKLKTTDISDMYYGEFTAQDKESIEVVIQKLCAETKNLILAKIMEEHNRKKEQKNTKIGVVFQFQKPKNKETVLNQFKTNNIERKPKRKGDSENISPLGYLKFVLREINLHKSREKTQNKEHS